MTQYTKPTVLPQWGETAGGADVLQPSNAEIQAGWPLTSVPPSRKRFNWILKYLSQGVRYMMQMGIPLWDAAEDYPVNARVMGSDGKTYKALQTSINQNPTTATAYWQVWGTEGRDDQLQLTTAFTTAGAAPSFTLSATPAPSALTANLRFRVKFHAVGTGADTLNINALGAKNLKQYDFTGAKVAASIAANQLVDVEYDGVDMVLLDPYPQAGLSFRNGLRSVSTTSTLAATDVGSSIELNWAGITVTLPPVATTPIGGSITFRTNYDCTLKGNGAENISSVAGPANTYALFQGDTLTLVNIGSAWYVVSAGFGTPSFGISKAANGYQKFPGGLIIQWGTATHPGNGTSATISFPIAFPTFYSSVVGIEQGTTPTIGYSFTKISLSQFGLTSSYASGNNSFSYIAIGY